jgi:hypothetical protein
LKSKTNTQLDYSRSLDVHKWSDYPEVNSFVDQIWEGYLATEFPEQTGRGKRPKGPKKQQFKVLLLDLYVAWREGPDLLIGVSMETGAYKANSRYNKLHISDQLPDVIHYLEEINLLGLHLGREGSKRSTRIWPTQELMKLFKGSKLHLLTINPHKDKEVIVLNDSDSKALEYSDEDYAEIPRMRAEMQTYNELLRKSFIDIGDLEEPFFTTMYWDRHKQCHVERVVRVNHFNKFVRRIFYRGNWQYGGRLHGGFWQRIDEEARKKILINDFKTVELDFSGLHVNIAYALEGLTPFSGDPYAVEPVLNVPAPEQRSLMKSLILMCFNATSLTGAFQAFRNEQPTGSYGKRLTNLELGRLLEAFKRKHPLIQNYLCSDQGVHLMNIDGAIAAKVVNHFTNKNEPVLCIHDSFICREQFKDELIQVMNEKTSDTLAGYIVGIKSNKQVPDVQPYSDEGIFNASKLKDIYLNHDYRQFRCTGYTDRWSEHKYWLHMLEHPIYAVQ